MTASELDLYFYHFFLLNSIQLSIFLMKQYINSVIRNVQPAPFTHSYEQPSHTDILS